jgi:23S rRNA (pseudouridine1915-N3)-methyltransferase
VRITLVCVGKVRAPFVDDIAHYERLLDRHVRLETVELAEAGTEPRPSPARVRQALASEAKAIARRIPGDAHVCALDREGRLATSEALARLLEERRGAGRDLCFVVGGPFGLDRSVADGADERISLGHVTLPHQLARVVLLEQLFRAHKIVLGERYHY